MLHFVSFEESRLIWTDGLLNRIASSDLHGGNRQVLASDSDAYINDIVIRGRVPVLHCMASAVSSFFYKHCTLKEYSEKSIKVFL